MEEKSGKTFLWVLDSEPMNDLDALCGRRFYDGDSSIYQLRPALRGVNCFGSA